MPRPEDPARSPAPKGSAEERSDPERRTVERRLRPTPMLSRWTLRGRRRGGRREGETECIYVDRPGGWILAGFAILVGLSLLDAGFTLDLLRRGATEANPVMRAALHLGDPAFVLIKMSITVLGVGFLTLHKNWPLGRACLVLALLGYSALTLYHLHGQRVVGGLPF